MTPCTTVLCIHVCGGDCVQDKLRLESMFEETFWILFHWIKLVLPDGSKLTIQTMVNTWVIAVKVNDIALISITNMGCLDYTSTRVTLGKDIVVFQTDFITENVALMWLLHNNGSYRLWSPQAVQI